MGLTADSIEREVLIEAPQQRVWDLITQPEHLEKWWASAGAEVDLRVGGHLTMKFKHEGMEGPYVCLIEEVDEPRAFAVRWAPWAGGAPVEPGNSTHIQFTLTAEGDATRLTVVESGFSELDYSDADVKEHFESNVNGWGVVLDSLNKLAGGVPA